MAEVRSPSCADQDVNRRFTSTLSSLGEGKFQSESGKEITESNSVCVLLFLGSQRRLQDIR